MSSTSWIDQLRHQAAEHFAATGFPRADIEEWRHTQFQPIVKTIFRPAGVEITSDAAETAQRFSFGNQAQCELVFVNGRFAPHLSNLKNTPRFLHAVSLRDALADDGTHIRQHLAQHARIEQNPFVAWNTSQFDDGAFVHLARGAAVEKPIHLLFVSSPSSEPTVHHPRVLVVMEDGASGAVVETYVGAGEGLYLANAVTEIVMGDDTSLDHCKLQQESLAAHHLATMQVDLGRAASFVSHAITMGGAITRNDLRCFLGGQHGHATLNGLVLIKGTQHCDNHTLLHHQAADCPSHELYKHVLDGQASAVFKGKIYVQKGAQKTDSKQTSKSLLLSEEAKMNSQPALEIYADDVKCTHGCTTGPVDEEMVFYLRSRGIADASSRHLLTYAFAADITRRIKVEPVRKRVEDYMASAHNLPQDLRISETGAFDDAAV
jgi:Fe-S cluster assembly protein SufD